MDGLYLYCQMCNNYVGGGDCGCGWRNRYLKEEKKSDIEDVSTEELIQELSSRLYNYEPDEFEDVLDQLRSEYVRD